MIFLENKSSCACLFLSRLNGNFYWHVQACMTIKSLLIVEAEAFTQLTTENSEVSQQRVWFQTSVLLVNHWYKLVNSNELWQFQFGFLENYILVEKTYFTNYVEWIENKVMVLNSTNKHLGKYLVISWLWKYSYWRLPASFVSLLNKRFVVILFTEPIIINCKDEIINHSYIFLLFDLLCLIYSYFIRVGHVCSLKLGFHYVLTRDNVR